MVEASGELRGLLSELPVAALLDLSEAYELDLDPVVADRSGLVERLLSHPEISAKEILEDLLLDSELQALAQALGVVAEGGRQEIARAVERALARPEASDRSTPAEGKPPRRVPTRVDLVMALALAGLGVLALCSQPLLLRTLTPYEAVHFTFVEQETRNYHRRESEAELPYMDPWGREFVSKFLGDDYALYSKGVNGVDDDGQCDDILMYGPGLPCHRFGHTGMGWSVRWSRPYLLVLTGLLYATYLTLRLIPRRGSTAKEALLVLGVGLPVACTLGLLADVAHAWVPLPLYSGLQRLGVLPFELFAGGSLILANYLGLFALRALHGPENGLTRE